MAAPDEPPFVVPLRGLGWHTELEVAPPTERRPPAAFDVAGAEGGPLRQISVPVLYTTATDRTVKTGWGTWFVKIYHCTNPVDADDLRRHLRQQAADIHRANLQIEGPRPQIRPPWAVVPVYIVTGGTDPTRPAPPTDYAVRADDIVERIQATLPAWFGSDNPRPELYLLAFSPQMDKVPWEALRVTPGVHHLVDFQGMAQGLDMMSTQGTVHCDIKPDNVCRYNNTDMGSGFVLIDTDAATRMEPAPTTLRTTEPYVYRGVREWQRDQFPQGLAIEPGRLRAQDRFCFALVVLVALAGKDWVETALLNWPDGDGRQSRGADDRDAVVVGLRQLWRDRRWEPLIQAAAEPFGPQTPGGQPDIERADWSAADWIERLIRAERESVPVTDAPREHPAGGTHGRLDRHLRAIRSYALAQPEPGPQLMRRGYEAIERRASAVASRAAVYSALPWAALPVVIVVVILVGALGLRK
jgi:hypothetical protein